DLHDAVVLAGRLHHAPALDEVVRHRLLAVHVLAGLAGPDRGEGVPVVRGGDDDGVHVAVLEHAANVLLDLRLAPLTRRGGLDGGGDDVGVRVADVDDLDVGERDEALEQLQAAAVDAADGQADAVVGLVGAGGGQGRQGGGGRGGVQELTAMHGES